MPSVRVQCPQCGKVLELAAPTPSFLCPACGSHITLDSPPAEAPWGGQTEDAVSSLQSIVSSSEVSAPRRAVRKVKSAPSRGPVIALVACGVIAIGLVATLAVLAARKSLPVSAAEAAPAKDGEYVRLSSMKSKAEELALSGQLAEAHAAYGKLLATSTGSNSADPRVRELFNTARADQERIYRLLISSDPPALKSVEPDATQTEASQAAVAPATTPTNVSPYEAKSVPEPQRSLPEPQTRPAVYPAPQAGIAPARPQVPPVFAQSKPASEDLDSRIGHSMQLAVDLILSNFRGAELAPGLGGSEVRRAGLHALCVYALLQAGQSLDDDRLSIHGTLMPPMIAAMKAHNLDAPSAERETPMTYAHSLRAAALAVYDRPEDRKVLEADVKWLVMGQKEGSYTYQSLLDLPWDNSNSQYGLLGVWAGAEVGVEVPIKYWEAVDRHWKTCQKSDGQWPYSNYTPQTTLAMTCGGLSSLMVTYDYLEVPKFRGEVQRDPFPDQIGRGLRWLEAADHAVDTPNENSFYLGYDLYSLERVGLASGLKFFGTHDWYRELADKAMKAQWPDGAYGKYSLSDDTMIATSYVLLFLGRGRHPVMMDKLRFEKFWANRPRDLANLAHFASHELEHPVNWQVVSVDRPWQDWFDSPVLFIASNQAPQFTEAHYEKLRSFVEAGGLILTQADGASDAFNRWVPTLAEKICPAYKLERLPPKHLLFSINYPITAPPGLLGVSNGSRLLIVHSPVDLSAAWQRQRKVTQKALFNLGINIFAYASGKKELRNRVANPCVPEPAGEPAQKIRIARLSYAGNWNPEPYAWPRLSKILQNESGVSLDIQQTPLENLAPDTAPLALLTGTQANPFSDAQCMALGRYVRAGGVVFIDSTGGQPGFANSVQQDLMPRAFPGARLAPVPADHVLMAHVNLKLRSFALNTLTKPPSLEMAQVGEGYVIFTPIDVTSGLLGTNTWGIAGYLPSTCEQVARNLVAWRSSAPTAAPQH